MASLDYYTKGISRIQEWIDLKPANFTFLRDSLFGLPSKIGDLNFQTVKIRRNSVSLPTQDVFGTTGELVNLRADYKVQDVYSQYYCKRSDIGVAAGQTPAFKEDVPGSEGTASRQRERILESLAEETMKIEAALDSAEEKLCADVLLNGAFTSKAKGTQTYDITAALLAQAAGAVWDGSSANPIADLVAAAKAVHSKSGIMPNHLLMNIDDVAYLCTNSNFIDQAKAGSQFIAMGMDYKALASNGVALMGFINVPGCGAVAVSSYMGQYTSGGSAVSYIPSGKAIFFKGPVGYMGYTGVYEANGVDNFSLIRGQTRRRTVYSKGEGDIQNLHVMIQDAPMAVPSALDSWAVLTTLRTVSQG